MAHLRLNRSEQFLLIQRLRDPQRPVDRATGRRINAALRDLEAEALDSGLEAVQANANGHGAELVESWLRDGEPLLRRVEPSVLEFLYDDLKDLKFPRHLSPTWVPLLDKVDTAYQTRNDPDPPQIVGVLAPAPEPAPAE